MPINLINPAMLLQWNNDDLSWNMKNCLNSLSRSRYQKNVVPGANRCFSLRRESSSWSDSFERFRSRVRSLNSAYVRGTGCSSSFGFFHAEIAVRKVIFSFFSKPLEWQMAYSSFYHFSSLSSSPHMFYSKRGDQMAYPDPLAWLQRNGIMPSSQSQWFFLGCLEEGHCRRYNRTCQEYSHSYDHFLQEYKCQGEKRKKTNHHSACCWHLIQYIKIILNWSISPSPSRYVGVSE